MNKWNFNDHSNYYLKKNRGHQSLKRADKSHFKRQRLFANQNKQQMEQLELLEPLTTKFNYSLPQLDYPEIHQIDTLEEYDKILKERIKINQDKNKEPLHLPKLNYQYKERYSVKKSVSQIELGVHLESFN